MLARSATGPSEDTAGIPSAIGSLPGTTSKGDSDVVGAISGKADI